MALDDTTRLARAEGILESEIDGEAARQLWIDALRKLLEDDSADPIGGAEDETDCPTPVRDGALLPAERRTTLR